MGLIGISLIVASFVCFCMYPSAWLGLARPLLSWRQPPPRATDASAKDETCDTAGKRASNDKGPAAVAQPDIAVPPGQPAPVPVPAPIPALVEDRSPLSPQHEDDDDDDEATTPKATPTSGNGADVPVFSLSAPGEDGDSDSDSDSDADDHLPPPMFPSPFSAQRASGPAVATAAPTSSYSRSMPPPPPPSLSAPSSASSAPSPRTPTMAPPPQSAPRRPPTLNPVRGAASTSGGGSLRPAGFMPVPNRGGPAPSRLAPSSGPAGLSARMPSAPSSAAAARGRNKVLLAPGHSPLDWAQRCADPTANLRNLPPDAPQLLRVKPSLLKTMNGRRGRDAWTALGGMVYNITPYVPFHPGGAGELLRCAGKDGTRLFQEVHAWVNYDNMLAACRIGILVDESHASSVAGPMEEMD